MSTNPNTVKSQHELNEGGRKSDVLLSTIEELERTKKQLEIAENILRELGYGYQSRSQYNKLISKANQYFEEQKNEVHRKNRL